MHALAKGIKSVPYRSVLSKRSLGERSLAETSAPPIGWHEAIPDTERRWRPSESLSLNLLFRFTHQGAVAAQNEVYPNRVLNAQRP